MLGIIGGTGLYGFELGENTSSIESERLVLDTPFGQPSSPLTISKNNSTSVVFLARHGENHQFIPSNVNYRANIYALKTVGVKALLTVSAVGSLREDLPPGSIALVDQYVDMTKMRKSTFFENDSVVHISTGEPVSLLGKDLLKKVAKSNGIEVHSAGTYVCVEGPRLGTRAESNFFRTIGCSVVGMTNCPEAFLAREAQIPYIPLVVITDYDSWREGDSVDVQSILKLYKSSLTTVKSLLCKFIEHVYQCEISSASLFQDEPARQALKEAVLHKPKNQSAKEIFEVLSM